MVTDRVLNYRQIIGAAVMLSLVAWYLVISWVDQGFRSPIPLIAHFGIVTAIFLFFWTLFTKFAWRCKWVRLGGLVVSTPDLNGRWVGTSTSKKKGTPLHAVLEIKQTLLTTICTGYTTDSIGESYSVRILSDPSDLTFTLAFLYNARRDVGTSIAGDAHSGVSILKLIEGPPRQLRGHYFR